MVHLGINDKLPPGQKSIVTVGNFDGVHKGHAILIDEVVKRCKAEDARSVVVTFNPHTRSVVYPELSQMLITTQDEKEILIESFGVDYLLVIPFNEQFSRLPSEDFVRTILADKLNCKGWVMGEGHSVGKNRCGKKNLLPEVVSKYHIKTIIANLYTQEDMVISSTQIRKLIIEGRISDAVALLGHPYLIRVQRTVGTKVGTKLGYPTLNFRKPSSQKVIPPAGVYAAELNFSGSKIQGALYFGNCPTFPDRDTHFEFHAFDLGNTEPINGEWCNIWLHRFIRKDIVFSNESELTVQIAQDINDIKEYFSQETMNGFNQREQAGHH
ncbi:Riboflavin kinase [Chitinispirillum alkaliphilum]|nr:Riboflavin kinase [Chitinispirillum alkaliphilum]